MRKFLDNEYANSKVNENDVKKNKQRKYVEELNHQMTEVMERKKKYV